MREKDWKYTLAKNGGKLYRNHLEPSAFKGTPSFIDKIGSKATEPMFYKVSYATVGLLGYRSGSNPVWGSLAYTAVHTLLKFFFWLIVISGGLGLKILHCLWEILKIVAPFVGKGLWTTVNFLTPLIGRLFLGILEILKTVAPFVEKGLLEIAKFSFPIVGKLLFGIFKLFGLGFIKLVSGIFSLIF